MDISPLVHEKVFVVVKLFCFSTALRRRNRPPRINQYPQWTTPTDLRPAAYLWRTVFYTEIYTRMNKWIDYNSISPQLLSWWCLDVSGFHVTLNKQSSKTETSLTNLPSFSFFNFTHFSEIKPCSFKTVWLFVFICLFVYLNGLCLFTLNWDAIRVQTQATPPTLCASAQRVNQSELVRQIGQSDQAVSGLMWRSSLRHLAVCFFTKAAPLVLWLAGSLSFTEKHTKKNTHTEALTWTDIF